MDRIITFLTKRGMSKKQLEKANPNQLQEIYNKFNNLYQYEEGEFPITKSYLKNYIERYGMKEVKKLMLHYYNINRMNDWIKTAKFIVEQSKKKIA